MNKILNVIKATVLIFGVSIANIYAQETEKIIGTVGGEKLGDDGIVICVLGTQACMPVQTDKNSDGSYNRSGKIKTRVFALMLLMLSCGMIISAARSLGREFSGTMIRKLSTPGITSTQYHLFLLPAEVASSSEAILQALAFVDGGERSGVKELFEAPFQLFDAAYQVDGGDVRVRIDESQRQKTEAEAAALVRKEKLAAAGGQLLNAAFSFLGEVFAAQEPTPSDRELAEALRSKLATCMDRDEQGRLQMTVTLPDEQAVEHLALSLAS